MTIYTIIKKTIDNFDGTFNIIVSIHCTDATTNQPTNGNNVVVNYDETLFDSSSSSFLTQHKSVTIPGQSVIVYSGSYLNGDEWAITGNSGGSNPQPPVNRCDLIISSIVINQPESFPGANDASITVNATSSYGPIQYSLDNGDTWQDSNTFAGIAGGVQSVLTQDSNDTTDVVCTASKTVDIPILRNLLISDPSVNLGKGNISRWNAAFNPIVFTYQRKDYEITGASQYTDNMPLFVQRGTTFAINGDLTILANLVALNNASGKHISYYVYISSANYTGSFLVLACDTSSVSVAVDFTETTAGFMNSNDQRPYYKIYTAVLYNDPVTGQPTTAVSKNSPNGAGIIKADVSNFAQSLLQAADKSAYNQINYRDANLSASYQISYQEHWEDGTSAGYTGQPIILNDPYYVTYTARQLQQLYGGNMAEFVPFQSLPAKWVTDFKQPVYSRSYPFDLSFIYSEDLAGLELFYKISLFDINMNPIKTSDGINGYLLNEDGSFLLNQDGSKFIIAEQSFYNTPIVEHVGLNRLLIDNDFDEEVYYFSIGIYYQPDGDDPIQVVNDQLVRVDKNCDVNSVYLRWIGLTGSWNYYRFIFNQEHTLDVQNASLITRYVSDWANADTIEDVVKKSASEKIQVHAVDMSIDEIKGCQSMKYSPKVQMCVQQSPPVWQTVILNTATFAEYESQLSAYEFAVTFNLPSINTQSQ